MKEFMARITTLGLTAVLAWGWQAPIKAPAVTIDRAEAFAAYMATVEQIEAEISAMRQAKSLTTERETALIALTGLDAMEFSKLSGPIKHHRANLKEVSARMEQTVNSSAKKDTQEGQLRELQKERARGLDAAMAEVFGKASPSSKKAIESFLAAPYRRSQ